MGSFHVVGSGAWHPAKSVHVVGNGAWRSAKEIWVYAGGAWRKSWNSRTISIYFAGGGRVSDGGQNYHDQIVFGVQVSDGASPSSYEWGGDFYGTGPTVQFDGPSYNLNGYTYISSGFVEVTVVISGQTYTASRTYSFTAGDEM